MMVSTNSLTSSSERHRRLTPAEKKVMAVYRKVMRQHFKAQAKALLEHLGGE